MQLCAGTRRTITQHTQSERRHAPFPSRASNVNTDPLQRLLSMTYRSPRVYVPENIPAPVAEFEGTTGPPLWRTMVHMHGRLRLPLALRAPHMYLYVLTISRPHAAPYTYTHTYTPRTRTHQSLRWIMARLKIRRRRPRGLPRIQMGTLRALPGPRAAYCLEWGSNTDMYVDRCISDMQPQHARATSSGWEDRAGAWPRHTRPAPTEKSRKGAAGHTLRVRKPAIQSWTEAQRSQGVSPAL